MKKYDDQRLCNGCGWHESKGHNPNVYGEAWCREDGRRVEDGRATTQQTCSGDSSGFHYYIHDDNKDDLVCIDCAKAVAL